VHTIRPFKSWKASCKFLSASSHCSCSFRRIPDTPAIAGFNVLTAGLLCTEASKLLPAPLCPPDGESSNLFCWECDATTSTCTRETSLQIVLL
jgi:hypothetical protein